MTPTRGNDTITFSKETIHSPHDARHFMRLKPIAGRVRILRDGQLLAQSDNAMRLIEAGRDIYDPTIYLPAADIVATLKQTEKQTHCPLKGDASYFDLLSATGDVDAAEIAWSYRSTLDFAAELKDLIAFYGGKVVIEEHPAADAA